MTRPKGEGPRNVAASIKARLLQKARKDGEEFNSILVRYVLERLLYRLANSPYADEFILKGALLFVVWSDRPHRATKDLDLLGSGTPDPLRLQRIFREVCEVQVVEDGLLFLAETVTAEPIREEAVYDGIRLRFTPQLGSARTPVQVDVGFGDVTTPEPLLTDIPVLLDQPAPRLRAYARESAIAEKLHAMVELGLGNSRMKDYYDVWFHRSSIHMTPRSFAGRCAPPSNGDVPPCRATNRLALCRVCCRCSQVDAMEGVSSPVTTGRRRATFSGSHHRSPSIPDANSARRRWCRSALWALAGIGR